MVYSPSVAGTDEVANRQLCFSKGSGCAGDACNLAAGRMALWGARYCPATPGSFN